MSEHLLTVAAAGFLVLTAAGTAAVSAQEAAPDTTAVPVYQADEVVVTASRYRSDVHLSHTNLPQVEIRRRQSAQDLPLLLQDIPGVFAYSDAGNGIGYTYLKIRGFDQRRVGVLVNGIPLNDPEDHQVYWVDLPDLASSLQDVQVQRGVSNGVGGVTAIGGTINLVTDVLGEEPEGRATLEAGSWGTSRRVVRYQTGELGRGLSTGLRLSQLASDGYRARSGSEQWAVFWSGRWRHGHHRLQANVYTGHELTHHAWDPAPASVLAVDRRFNPETYWNAVDDFRQPHYELHWEFDLAPDLLLRNSVYTIHGEGFYENFRGDRDAASFSLDAYRPDLYQPGDEVDLVRTKSVRKDQTGWVPSLQWSHPGGRLVAGGDAYRFHSDHWGDVLSAGAGTGGEALTPDQIPGGLKYYAYTGDKDAWSLYLNERWEFVPGLTLLADLQYQHREYDFLQADVGNFSGAARSAYSVAHDFLNPKGGLFWQTPWRVAGSEIGLYGHAGVTHREPADSDYWDAWGGPDELGRAPLFAHGEVVRDGEGAPLYVEWSGPLLDEEKVVNWEGGVAVRAQDLSVTVNGYWMDFTNEIVPTGVYDPDRGYLRANAQKALHRGVELGLRWRPHPDHQLSVGASRSWNEYDSFSYATSDTTRDDFSGNPIALFPDILMSAAWTSEVGAATCGLRLRHVGRQYLDNTGDEGRTIDGSTVVDLSVSLDLGRAGAHALAGLDAHLRILNLLDEAYETAGYHDPWYDSDGENMYIPGAPRSFLAGVDYDF
ncbi:MAG TPA: TonB-dependent receptor [Candidatus Krumholzibacteria bacterium]|nr:TonB-dependent receptor [Candidatus Krumholzibacteria bacterium]HPD70660.1 TonB-dependent receptor [Candidatus Krumholzibacteria bacterium]HRY39640.1 TonB-dependent receptor [Candidatus Krumholzibacteria bacterium]